MFVIDRVTVAIRHE